MHTTFWSDVYFKNFAPKTLKRHWHLPESADYCFW